MKNLLGDNNLKLILQVLVILLLVFLIRDYFKTKSELKIYQQNQQSLLIDGARELQLTKKEMKLALNSKVKVIIDSMHFKSKNVTKYIETHYDFRDSIKVTSKTIYDSIRNKYNWVISKGCYTISGYVNPKADSVTAVLTSFNDTLDIFTYKGFDHRFLFIKWGRYNTSGIWSRCKHDTIKVVKNYSLRKR